MKLSQENKVLEMGIYYSFNSVRGRLLDKRHLLGSVCLLGHLS